MPATRTRARTKPTAAAEPDAGSAAQRERRKRILDATLALASKGGYDAVQMRAVAERADVALGTLYRYFPSKIHLLVGALIAAVIWQVLQVAGGYVVSHQLHRANELYGTFGVVLGLVAWLYLQAEATLWAAEVDVVLARRLWPVSVLPETDSADSADDSADADADDAAGSDAAADRAGPAAPAPRPAGDNESAGGNAPVSDGKPSRDGKAGKAA